MIPAATMSQDEDENISTLLAMGFSDLDEVKRALRIAKNDISEAVTILTQGVPSGPMPMIMDGPGGGGSGDMSMPPPAAHQAGAGTGAGADAGPIESPSGFPIREFYELEQRVFQASDDIKVFVNCFYSGENCFSAYELLWGIWLSVCSVGLTSASQT